MHQLLKYLVVLLLGLGVGWTFGSLTATSATVTNDPNSGRFLGTPEVIWLDNGRDMKLSNDYIFIDSRSRSWVAEKGCVVNGASIPRFLWTAIGSPFAGRYRNASIVHDSECQKMSSPSTDVHRMFYDACRAGGVSEKQAKYLYWAVANYGPTWVAEASHTVSGSTPIDGATLQPAEPTVRMQRVEHAEPSAEILEWAKAYFEEKNPSIEDVPRLAPPRVIDGVPSPSV